MTKKQLILALNKIKGNPRIVTTMDLGCNCVIACDIGQPTLIKVNDKKQLDDKGKETAISI